MIPPGHLPVPEDVDCIMLVMSEAFDPHFREAWSRRQVEDAMRIGNCDVLLHFDDEQCVGFALSRRGFEEEELLLFAVRPAYRRKGHGARLLRTYLNTAKERGAERVYLEMREGNSAQQLYEDNGFRSIGRRVDYYRTLTSSRIDAITYARTL